MDKPIWTTLNSLLHDSRDDFRNIKSQEEFSVRLLIHVRSVARKQARYKKALKTKVANFRQ
jgi:hypothetical protein